MTSLTLVLVIAGAASAIHPPLRNGIPIPGYGPEQLALGGARSLGFGDPVCVLTNPSCISDLLDCRLLSAAYGPVFSKYDITDGNGSYSESWTDWLGSSSLGMKVRLIEGLNLGFGATGTAEVPFTRVDYIPGGGDSLQGSMEMEGYFSEGGIGLSWDAARWFVLGAAVGLRVTRQEFDISTEEPGYGIGFLGYEWNETTWHLGAALPLERFTLGASWASPGDYTPGILAAGGAVNITSFLTAGAELESSVLDDAEALTGRVFCMARPMDDIVLRTGIFHAAHTECISREGLGLGVGAGYTTGIFTINAGISWSPVKGMLDHYGYTGMESYEGTSTVVSLGATLDRLN
ncbi:MAG: hypothetical protein AVO35_12090 [Candidatus Aegiribacteria sp. MLS_C]|nr:MAG: hypothetical protein AVO35_12090 [Candidatus Aegiribacteria sp. MLS_C]